MPTCLVFGLDGANSCTERVRVLNNFKAIGNVQIKAHAAKEKGEICGESVLGRKTMIFKPSKLGWANCD
jgi:hypothetical protein